MNCETLRISNFRPERHGSPHIGEERRASPHIFNPLMQIRQSKIGISGGLFLVIPKLENLNETSIKNPSYSGDQLIRMKSLQDTKLYFGVIYSSKRMLNKFA